MKRNRLVQYVPYHLVEDMKAEGWILRRALLYHHGAYCVLMEYRP